MDPGGVMLSFSSQAGFVHCISFKFFAEVNALEPTRLSIVALGQ